MLVQYLPEVTEKEVGTAEEVVQVNLNRPMAEIRKLLSQYPIRSVRVWATTARACGLVREWGLI